MFRPSQPLLFRPMPPLHKLLLHPPLPLNPRESKQLLNLLSTSFRQALDREHSFKDDRVTERANKIAREGAIKHNSTPREQQPSNSDLGLRPPTDRHMNAILNNPLFSWSPAAPKAEKADKDPMEVFDMAVAKGMMNPSYAIACLEAKKRKIVQSAVLSVREGMRDSGAGLKVLRWLVSSGTANDNHFLDVKKHAYLLMEYVVAEDLQEIAWTWIRREFEKHPKISNMPPLERNLSRRALLNPLMALMHAEAQSPASLDAAYLCLSRAAGYLEGLPADRMRDLLGPPIRFLLNRTTAPLFHHPPASEAPFDSFAAVVSHLPTKDVNYHLAYLRLLHPARPSAKLALSYLKELDSPPQGKAFSPAKEQTIRLGLDTAKFLLENEQLDDALWVMQYLRTTFPHHLGLAQREQLEQAKSEASILQLLDGLTLA